MKTGVGKSSPFGRSSVDVKESGFSSLHSVSGGAIPEIDMACVGGLKVICPDIAVDRALLIKSMVVGSIFQFSIFHFLRSIFHSHK